MRKVHMKSQTRGSRMGGQSQTGGIGGVTGAKLGGDQRGVGWNPTGGVGGVAGAKLGEIEGVADTKPKGVKSSFLKKKFEGLNLKMALFAKAFNWKTFVFCLNLH